MTSPVAADLTATVTKAAAELRSIDAALARHRPAPDRWSIQEVIGHLIDSAANNHQRFVRAQFVDELVSPKYEQNEWVRAQRYNDVDWLEIIELWSVYNRHLAHVIRHVDAQALAVPCRIGLNEPVTLQFLIEDYVAHMKFHLAKIAQRIASQGTPSR